SQRDLTGRSPAGTEREHGPAPQARIVKNRGLRHFLQHFGQTDLKSRLKVVFALTVLPPAALAGLLIWAQSSPAALGGETMLAVALIAAVLLAAPLAGWAIARPILALARLRRGVFDAVGEGICVLDAERRLILWNDLFQAHLGYAAGALRAGAP